ncbi:hypothetical protein [Paraburkholderia sp. BCC1884]|uniref:hypothetical protein n=1 Tax=Paraburkholderia sp. BCC1884 TaxID=2562668 RepID=UPI0011840CD6|nr:hypothetical protein [Paraburkholderia sp. BCC1884]
MRAGVDLFQPADGLADLAMLVADADVRDRVDSIERGRLAPVPVGIDVDVVFVEDGLLLQDEGICAEPECYPV